MITDSAPQLGPRVGGSARATHVPTVVPARHLVDVRQRFRADEKRNAFTGSMATKSVASMWDGVDGLADPLGSLVVEGINKIPQERSSRKRMPREASAPPW
jgi:hypothetical protein